MAKMQKKIKVTNWEKLIEWFAGFFPKKTVYGTTPDKREELGPLLIRYYLFNGGDHFPSLYLHKLVRSDDGRDLHDHPWWFWTFLLTGAYFEEMPYEFLDKKKGIIDTFTIERREPFRFYFREPTWTHRLILDRPVWTLVLRGTPERDWGFYTPEGWVRWEEYKGDREIKDDDERVKAGVQPDKPWDRM